jgi:hypothetical protein
MNSYLVSFKNITKTVLAMSYFDAQVKGAWILPHTTSDSLSSIEVEQI